jgi:transposase
MRPHSSKKQRETTLDRWVNSKLSLRQFAELEDIPISTLHAWKNKHLKNKATVTQKFNRESWSAEAKFSVVLETSTLSEVDLGAYCREKGLFPDQVREWKESFIRGDAGAAQVGRATSSKEDKKKIKQLERELHRKEKALAETAALLVLRKKFNALWEENEDG